MRGLPRRLVATGPARDELVVHFVVWSPEEARELQRLLAGQGEPARPVEERGRG